MPAPITALMFPVKRAEQTGQTNQMKRRKKKKKKVDAQHLNLINEAVKTTGASSSTATRAIFSSSRRLLPARSHNSFVDKHYLPPQMSALPPSFILPFFSDGAAVPRRPRGPVTPRRA